MFIQPLITFDTISKGELNDCLVAWDHAMGPWERPDYGREAFHGLRHHGRLVGVTACAPLIRPTCGKNRDTAFELGRVCAIRGDLCRAVLRLWREFVFPPMCALYGYQWVISYQDAIRHSGQTYRFDGWELLGKTSSGTDLRTGKRGRDKNVWGWNIEWSKGVVTKKADLYVGERGAVQ